MKKISKNTLPDKHDFSDFKCSGPVATIDGSFDNTRMADFGCFSQGDSDKNKYYFACVCQSKINNKWYVYIQFGRTGEIKPGGYQFWECISENEAENVYIKQCSSKNTKRGIWTNHPILGKIFTAKPKKDLYNVRQLSGRSVLLSDANNISNSSVSKIINKSGADLDIETQKLFADLGAGTNAYTRNSIVGATIPSQSAIDEVRVLLDVATKITNKLSESEYGDHKELKEISTLVYSRIPKKKHRSSTDWILDPTQIYSWRQDLDCYESALDSSIYECNTSLSALNLLKFKYVSRNSELGGWIYEWWPTATANKHSYLGKLKVKNLWYFERAGDTQKITDFQKKIGRVVNEYQPMFQPDRKDKIDKQLYENTYTASLFHGTRSINVAAIIKEGLRFPKELSRTQIIGSLFGGGIYWASDVKKSIGYTSYKGGYWSGGYGGINGRGAFMFIGDVVLGKMYKCKYGYTNGPPKGFHSVYAKAGYSGVQNDEHITFDKNGFKLRYLVEF